MGHKVHPIGFRLGILYPWQSKWFADKNYTDFLHEDLGIRRAVLKRLSESTVAASGRRAADEPREANEPPSPRKHHRDTPAGADAYLVAKSVAEQLERRGRSAVP
jgi:ribosomal protein S3